MLAPSQQKVQKNQNKSNKSRKTKEKPCGPWPSLPSAVLAVADEHSAQTRPPLTFKTRLPEGQLFLDARRSGITAMDVSLKPYLEKLVARQNLSEAEVGDALERVIAGVLAGPARYANALLDCMAFGIRH